MPREYVSTRSRSLPFRPTSSNSSSMRARLSRLGRDKRPRSTAGCRGPTAGRRDRGRRRTRIRSAAAPREADARDRSRARLWFPTFGSNKVVRTLIMVVFPAPFGPSSPNSSPRPTKKLTPRSALTSTIERRNTPVRDRYVRQRASTSMADIEARTLDSRRQAGLGPSEGESTVVL